MFLMSKWRGYEEHVMFLVIVASVDVTTRRKLCVINRSVFIQVVIYKVLIHVVIYGVKL